MKTKIKRHSRSVLSVILAVCMLVTCFTVGLVATDAAKAESSSVGAKLDADESVDTQANGAAAGAKANSASVGANADTGAVGASIDDDSAVGAADVYAVTAEWNSWGKTYFPNSNPASLTFTLAANTTYEFKIYSNYGATAYYGADNNTTFTQSVTNQYLHTGKGNAKLTTTYGGVYTFTLQREDQGDGAVSIDITYPSSGGVTHPDIYMYGAFNGTSDWDDTPTRKMTYAYDHIEGTNHYFYYYYYLNAEQTHYFNFSDLKNQYKWDDNGNNNNDVELPHIVDARKEATKNSGSKCFKVSSPTTKQIVWVQVKNSGEKLRVWVANTSFYLTGYVNAQTKTEKDYPFIETAAGSGIFKCEITSTTATHYVTVYDGAATYHPENINSANGAQSDPHKMNNSANGDPKWMVTNSLNKKVVFTWNTNNWTLSWTNGKESAVVYAKDGCAPIDWNKRSTNPKNYPGATNLDGYTYSGSTKYLYNFARIADTHVTCSDGASFTSVDCDIADGTSGSTYEYGTVEGGNTLTITTTIEDTKDTGNTGTSWRSKYYVAGWCINGVTYSGNNSNSLSTTVKSNGVYTMTYTVPEDITAGTKIEITPIYYFADSSNTITFYLEGFSSVSGDGNNNWGDTPYVYPFYGSLSGYQNSFGVYPGQPFVCVDGKYSTQLPITSNAIYSNTNDGTKIKGVTVSNGYADHVHRNLHFTKWQELGGGGAGDDQYHMQTYDFDDFYKIYTEKRDSNGNLASSIILRIKNETTRYNRNTYGGQNDTKNWSFSYTSNPSDSLTAATVQDIAANGNGWELLTDRYGRPVDLFGNVIGTEYSAAAEASKTAIRAISSGYNENIAGDYGTSWLIYTPDTNTCTESSGVYTCSTYTLQKDTTTDRYAIPPSIFLLSSTSSFNLTDYPNVSHDVDGYSYTDSVNNYKTMYTTLKTSGNSGVNALGRYVYVSYEKNAQRIGSDGISTDYGAKRLDGRWYYTYATDMVNANIKIQYYNNGSYVDEAEYETGYNNIANQGKHTGCKAYFTNTSFDGAVQSPDVLIDSGNFEFTAQTATGWKFDGWFIEYDGGDNYSQISSSANASTPMSASDTLVARFEPITSGYLNISHTIGTDATHTGTGTAALRVKVYTDNTKSSMIYDSGSTTDDVLLDGNYIANNLGGFYIDVTLTTTPSADDLVASITYDAFNTAKSITATNTGTLNTKAVYTSNFGFTVDKLFTNSTQDYLSLSYISKLTAVVHNYSITYNFAKRDSASNDKSFTVKSSFTSKEYETYVDTTASPRKVSDAFIKLKAPFESNFMKTLNLNYAGATQSVTGSNPITHTITISFTPTATTTKYAIFNLPYAYQTSTGTEGGVAYKKYTAKTDATENKVLKNDNTATFEISTNYLEYFTSTGSQTNVKQDPSTPNHVGNDFITAPKVIWDSLAEKYLYFNYWQIYKTDRTTKVAKVYHEDFHNIAYDNYYVTPVYKDKDATEGDEVFVDPFQDALGATITYLGDSRNQWNTDDNTTHSDATHAGDLIYNDFAFSFSYQNQILKTSNDVQEIGLVVEQIAGSDSVADASVSDMNTYKTYYKDTEAAAKASVQSVVTGNATTGFIKKTYTKDQLNNKNRMEKYLALYSRYGQNANLAFATDSVVDNYVYRAYSYIKLTNGSYAISDPAYFCMKYSANLGYTGA